MTFSADDTIETIAAAQLGLVTRNQLLQHGIPAHAIDRRLKAGRMRALQRGVYRVGPLVAPHARELAAVLACGPQAVLSHRSAARLWRLIPDTDEEGLINVSIRNGDRGHRPNLRAHRVSIEAEDMTILHGVPVTSASRTLADLAMVLVRREMERALAQAERLDLLDRPRLVALAAARAGRPGGSLLHALLGNGAVPALTRSEAEERFLALIRKAQLPAPETNALLAGHEVDFLWRQERLVVEVDGFAFHSSQRSFESDRRRDARLTASGLRVMRVTWRQVMQEPEAMLVRLAQTLARTG